MPLNWNILTGYYKKNLLNYIDLPCKYFLDLILDTLGTL